MRLTLWKEEKSVWMRVEAKLLGKWRLVYMHSQSIAGKERSFAKHAVAKWFDIPEFIRRHLRRLRRGNENDVMQRILVTFVFDCIPYKKEDLQFEWDCYI